MFHESSDALNISRDLEGQIFTLKLKSLDRLCVIKLLNGEMESMVSTPSILLLMTPHLQFLFLPNLLKLNFTETVSS